jgi:hypothetical protein
MICFFSFSTTSKIPFNPIHTSERFAYLRIVFSCKDSVKFRFSEENTNKLAFLSVKRSTHSVAKL